MLVCQTTHAPGTVTFSLPDPKDADPQRSRSAPVLGQERAVELEAPPLPAFPKLRFGLWSAPEFARG